jgi:hypothetical protein
LEARSKRCVRDRERDSDTDREGGRRSCRKLLEGITLNWDCFELWEREREK